VIELLVDVYDFVFVMVMVMSFECLEYIDWFC